MAILLTGGAGYIGSHTAVALIDAGFDVILADNFSNSSPKVLARIGEITGKTPPCYAVDVCRAPELEPVFHENVIEGVIHFAGLKAVGDSVREPIRYYRNNLDSTLTLLELMAKHRVKHLVFSSSATVYGDQPAPLTEASETGRCSNAYGWTKFMIETIIRDACRADLELSAVLLRYFNPVGAHASGRIGENPNGTPNNLMPFITQVAVGKLKQLHIFGNDYPTKDGTGVRDYIHVVDLARGHLDALRYAKSRTGCDEINLGTGAGCSVLEMVNTFSRVNNVPIPYEIVPRRPGDLSIVFADPKKAAERLGWRAQRTLDDMCRDSWNWQKNNPNGYDAGTGCACQCK